MTQQDMNTKVRLQDNFALAVHYRWRDKAGDLHRIQDMETRHLFHVVRMIWDHSMPKEWQTRWPRRYYFDKFYTIDYMSLSIRLMLPALLNRRDLTPEMMYWLSFMESCLLERRVQIPFVLKVRYQKHVAT